jgi:hypothetical protein
VNDWRVYVAQSEKEGGRFYAKAVRMRAMTKTKVNIDFKSCSLL